MKWGKQAVVWSVAMLFLLACVCSAEAQGRRGQGPGQQRGGPGGPPPGGPGGFGGPGMGMGMMPGMGGMFGGMGGGMSDVMLLAREDVQKELELVDDQLEQLNKLRETSGQEMRDMFSGLRDLPREEMGPKMAELMREAQAKTKKALDEILLPHQSERLGQLVVQWQLQGGGLAQSEEVAKELGISDEQRDQLRTKARELERALRKKLTEDLLKELTPEQQAKYKELVGEPFEFQRDERFGPGRGFGAPGGFGGPGAPGAPGGGPGAPRGGRRGN